MKKWIWVAALAVLLSGCGSTKTWETVADEPVEPVMAPMAQIQVQLPDEAGLPAIEGDTGRIYLSQDYEIVLQTLEAGDLEATIRSMSGYEKDQLTVLETRPQGLKRYDFVWTAAGEEGQLLGRGVVLDDGNYHYTMSVLRPADTTEQTQTVWRSVFESFTLA